MKYQASLLLVVMLALVAFAQSSQIPSRTSTPRPFLTLPVGNFEISEGWDYDLELKLHPDIPKHYAIDFRAPRGTPVCAAADGCALQSFQTYYLPKLDKPGVHEFRKRRRLGFGLGHFVQIWHPDQGVFTSYSHLDEVSDQIPYAAPVEVQAGVFDPIVVYQPLEEMLRICRPVKQGQLIGYIGDTGLSMDYEERPDVVRDYAHLPSWDLPHLHFEVYTRNADGKKELRWDPYGIYGKAAYYVSGTPEATRNLWLLDSRRRPKFGL